jgi:hypothetical protein
MTASNTATATKRRPSKKASKRKPSKKQIAKWEDAKKELVESLVTGVQSTDPEAWLAMLDRQRDFINYSFFNTRLILMTWLTLQHEGRICPATDITTVAPRTRWARRGRTIRPEHKRNGLPIFVPMTRRVRREEDDDETATVQVRYFRLRYVYDVTQTEGKDWTRPHPRAIGDGGIEVEEYTHKLVEYLGQEGIEVEFRPIALTDALDMTVQGFWTPLDRRIVVGTRTREGVVLDAAMQLRILLHETAHALLGHVGSQSLEERSAHEVEAESSAYIMGKAIGLPVDDYSFGYVKVWLNRMPEDKRGNELLSVGNKVSRVARNVLTALGAFEEESCADSD